MSDRDMLILRWLAYLVSIYGVAGAIVWRHARRKADNPAPLLMAKYLALLTLSAIPALVLHFMGFVFFRGFPDENLPFTFFAAIWDIYFDDPLPPIPLSNLLVFGALWVGWFIANRDAMKNLSHNQNAISEEPNTSSPRRGV